MLIVAAAGSIYHFSIVPRALRRITRYRSLKDIPTSRDLFVALAWGVLITFIPHAMRDRFSFSLTTGLVFLWTFLLAYLRSLIFDLRDIEGDRIMGRETLVTIIGEKRVRRTILVALQLSLIVLGSLLLLSLFLEATVHDFHPIDLLFQIPAILYVWLFMKWSNRIASSQSSLFNILAHGQFFVAGFGAWLASLITA
jgi:4-hydroxybenzoate polyprenyltransferase